jgi:hypothetical protein
MPPLRSWHSTMSERSSIPSLLFDDDQVILLRLTLPRSTPPRPPTNRRETSRRAALAALRLSSGWTATYPDDFSGQFFKRCLNYQV